MNIPLSFSQEGDFPFQLRSIILYGDHQSY